MNDKENRLMNNSKQELKEREAMEECVVFMAKMIEKYGDEVLSEIKAKEGKEH